MSTSKKTVFVFLLTAISLVGMYMIGCDSSSIEENFSLNSSNRLTQLIFDFQNEESDISISLYNGIVHLYNPINDSMNNQIIIPYQIQLDNNNTISRLLCSSSSLSDRSIFISKISDNNNNILLTCKIETDPVDSNTFYYSEITETDFLTIQKTINEDTIFERYNLNNNIYELSFTAEELNDFKQFINKKTILNYALDEEPNIENNKYSKFLNFDKFYDKDISLNNNFDGEILTELLTNTDFQNWYLDAKSQLNITTNPGLDISAEKLCGWAGLTSYFKCLFGGGVANFICIAATGTSLACAIAAVAS